MCCTDNKLLMNCPKVSIITPAYNSAKDIEACIVSVAQQTYANKEHLIIDNQSGDGTLEIVKKYALLYPHIQCITERDGGIYDAMNKGIERTSGEWLYFLGSDDVLYDKDVLADLMSSEEALYSDIIYGNVEWGPNGALYDGEFTFVKLIKKNICHQAIFFRRNVFDRLGKFDLQYKVLADWAFNLLWIGRDDIHRSYRNRVIATYGLGGYSSTNHDPIFHTGLRDIVRQHYPEAFLLLFDRCLTIEERAQQISLLSDGLAERDEQITSLSNQLAERDQQINKMISSSSWRLTKPIRKLTHSVRKRGRKIRALLSLAKNMTGGFGRLKFAKKRDPFLYKGRISVDYAVATDYVKGLVTIAIISKDGYDLIRPCIESILNHCGKHDIEIIIGDTGTTDKQVLKFYRTAQKRFRNIRFVRFEEYFFSRNYNELVSLYANGEYLVLLNNDTIATSGWLDALIAPLEDKRIGIVGAKLLNRDVTIQHAGIEYNNEGHGYHVFRNEPSDLPAANITSIVPGVTFACVAMRHDVYDRFQLSEDFIEECQDTDFCLRLSAAGFDILYESKAELFHFEGSSRDWRKGESDTMLLNKRWGEHIRKLSLMQYQRRPFDNDAGENAIVVIRDDGIGDLLMGISSFKMLRDKHQNRKLILLTYERNIAMMKRFGIFDEILPIPNGKKYAPLPVPSKGTTVFNLINIEMDFGGPFAVSKDDNMVHRHIAFTRKFGLDTNTYSSVPLQEYPTAKARIHQLLRDMGYRIDLPFVSFNLMASNPARSWWEPYYPSLIEAVERMGFVPIFIGTKESPYFKGKNAINLIGKTNNIPEYIEALKLGKYIISSDTSACHIAALAGIPFLAIFTGGVLAKARLNFYQKYEVIEPNGLDCYPCWDVGCKHPTLRWKQEPCRLMLTPEAVISKFETLVRKHPVAPGIVSESRLYA